MQSFRCIESLRAYLAWWVVLGHAVQLASRPGWLPTELADLLMQGDKAVNVFMIVSGFVIAHLVIQKREPYSVYIGRRFLRLFPIYAVCVLLAVATVSAYETAYIDLPFADGKEMRIERLALQDEHLGAHIFAHLTLLHGLIPEAVLKYSSTTFLAPAWSLSLEWQFYLIAPLLILPIASSLPRALVGTAVMAIVGVLSHKWLREYYQYSTMLLLCLKFFAAGILSRLALQYIERIPLRADVAWFAVFTAAALARSIELAIWLTFLVFALVESGKLRPAGKVFQVIQQVLAGNSTAAYLGKISYSTYLIHIPAFAVSVAVFHSLFGIALVEEMWAAVAFGLLLTLVLSMVLYRTVEQPFIAIGRRLQITPKQAGASSRVA